MLLLCFEGIKPFYFDKNYAQFRAEFTQLICYMGAVSIDEKDKKNLTIFKLWCENISTTLIKTSAVIHPVGLCTTCQSSGTLCVISDNSLWYGHISMGGHMTHSLASLRWNWWLRGRRGWRLIVSGVWGAGLTFTPNRDIVVYWLDFRSLIPYLI